MRGPVENVIQVRRPKARRDERKNCMRSSVKSAVYGICVLLMVGQAWAEQPSSGMAPGLWQITLQTKSPLLSAPISHTVCIAAPFTTKPGPPKSRPKDDCQVTSDAGGADETAFTIRCTAKKITSSSRFKYLGDHFEGTTTITEEHLKVEQVYTGTRIGDCDEDLLPRPLPTTITTPFSKQ